MVSSHSAIGPSSGSRAFEGSSCFAKLAYSSVTLALSPHFPSRSAQAVRPASLAASARRSACHQSPLKTGALHSQGSVLRERDRKLRPRRFGRSSVCLGTLRAASSPEAFEATIEHARTVLHQSPLLSCAAHLPLVERARSACICACLVIEAGARRFSSDA